MGNTLSIQSTEFHDLVEEFKEWTANKNRGPIISVNHSVLLRRLIHIFQNRYNEDWGCVIEVVRSKTGKEYFAIGLIKSSRVFFLLRDEDDELQQGLGPGDAVKILKTHLSEFSSVKFGVGLRNEDGRYVQPKCPGVFPLLCIRL